MKNYIILLIVFVLLIFTRIIIWKVIKKVKREIAKEMRDIDAFNADKIQQLDNYEISLMEKKIAGGQYYRLELFLSIVFWVLLGIAVYIILFFL
ncbi:MAG: hypothetical protein PHR39_02475 [Actinomycetota bacterium]|nr:hypothetical protein [Actinomycetota bacterium]